MGSAIANWFRLMFGDGDSPEEERAHTGPTPDDLLAKVCEDCRRKLAPRPATCRVEMSPGALAACVGHAWTFPSNEIGLLALGRIEGDAVSVTRAVPAKGIGTSTNIEFTPEDFAWAREAAADGEITVGWIHSHPGHTVFFSETDVRFQEQAQQLNPNWIGIVIDPFQEGRIEMKCYRVRDGKETEIPIGPRRTQNGAKADSD